MYSRGNSALKASYIVDKTKKQEKLFQFQPSHVAGGVRIKSPNV